MGSSSSAAVGGAHDALLARRAAAWWVAAAALVASSSQAQVTVTDGGTPSYSIAIKAPPGINGVAPRMALVYTGGLNRAVGQGWTLSGVSSIERCGATRAVDSIPGAVSFGSDDKLCLDGQRLIQSEATGSAKPFPQMGDSAGLTSGNYREFRLERDPRTRVRAYGASPDYFKVWTEGNTVMEYGNSPGAAASAGAFVAGGRVWALSRTTDVSGNYMQYVYADTRAQYGGGQADWNIAEIRYTGNGSQQPRNKLVFTYVDRPDNGGDRSVSFQSNGIFWSIQRLASVTAYVDTTAVSTTKLEYSIGPTTKRSLLTSVKECSGDGTGPCLPATTFAYTPGSTNYAVNTTYTKNASGAENGLATLSLGADAYQTYGVITGDFNGDGRQDILRWSPDPSQNKLFLSEGVGNYRAVPAGTGPGQFNITDENLFGDSANSVNRIDNCYLTIAADFNGDGLTDLFRFASTGLGLTWENNCPTGKASYLYLSSGDGSFTRSIVRDASNQSPINLGRGRYQTTVAFANFAVADFNLDGKLDILVMRANTGIDGFINVGSNDQTPKVWCSTINPNCWAQLWLGNGDGSFTKTVPPVFGPIANPPFSGTNGYWVPFSDPTGRTLDVDDVNGDGIPDLGPLLGDGKGNFREGGLSYCSTHAPFAMGDMNGDGRPDGICPSNGAVFFGGGIAVSPSVAPYGSGLPQGIYGQHAFDLDGDGRTDFLFPYWNGGNANRVYRSTGFGAFEVLDDTSLKFLPMTPPHSYEVNRYVQHVGNFTGSGTSELLIAVGPSCSIYTFGCTFLHRLYVKTDVTPPDLLSSVTSPTGQVTTLTYAPLTNTTRYASDWGTSNAATFPARESMNRARYDRGVPSTVSSSYINQTPSTAVVITMTQSTGVGSGTRTTEFAYRGYKVDQHGRGALGFREIRQQSDSPDGTSKLTQVRKRLQKYPYVGSIAVTETYLGAMSPITQAQGGQLLARSENTYCDITSAAGTETAATLYSPCPVTAKIMRPYVRKTVQSAFDLNGTALPTSTTTATYSGGYPTLVETQTVGSSPAGQQTFTSATVNEYFADSIGGDNWLLGLLKKSTVTKTAPNSLNAITTSAGSAPKATATAGP